MEITHTPGPWTVGSANGCANNHAICTGPYVIARVVESAGERVEGGKRTQFDEGKGNVALIAAAPDLLAALRAVCQRALLHRDDWDGSAREAIHQAYGAIAKAEGKGK